MAIKLGTIVYDKNNAEYEVVNHIGGGGFGQVYKIIKRDDGSVWALKTLGTLNNTTANLKGIINEGNLATQLSHPNIIKYEFFHDGSISPSLPPYIIMEFANNGTLSDIIRKPIVMTNDLLKEYFYQLINGMEIINSKLIHRDIKPENILIKDGQLKISDFGLAKIIQEQTRAHTFKGWGTCAYMSPEAWKNEESTIQMDIYSMGIVFFELATLKHPLNVKLDASETEWRDAHLNQMPIAPEKINIKLSPELSQLILRMIEKNKQKRFKQWSEIQIALKGEDIQPKPKNELVQLLINKRAEKDNKLKEELIMKEKQQKEQEDFNNLINRQLEQDIVSPLRNLIDEFNKEYAGNKITISSISANRYSINLISGNTLVLDIRPTTKQAKIINDFGREITIMEQPKLDNREILAWGYFQSEEERGFNILLVKNENEGKNYWMVLTNTNSALIPHEKRRYPEPFPFDFDEIGREINVIRAMHIYSTIVEPMKLEHFVDLIREYI